MAQTSQEFTVSVPGDLADTIEELGGYAIDQTREESPVYAMPCHWSAERISGEPGDWEVTFKVTQTYNE